MLKQIAVIGALLVVDIAHAAVLDTKPVGEENFEQSKTYDSDSSSNNAEPATRGKQSYVRHALASSEEADTLHAVYPGRHYGHGHGHSVASSEEAGTAGIVHAVYPGRHYGHGHTVASSDEAGTVYAVHPRRHYGHGHKEASSEEADTAGTVHVVYPERYYGHGQTVASSEEAGTVGTVQAVYPVRHRGADHTVAVTSSEEELSSDLAYSLDTHFEHVPSDSSQQDDTRSSLTGRSIRGSLLSGLFDLF